MKKKNSAKSGFDSQNKIKNTKTDTKVVSKPRQTKRTKGNGGCK